MPQEASDRVRIVEVGVIGDQDLARNLRIDRDADVKLRRGLIDLERHPGQAQ